MRPLLPRQSALRHALGYRKLAQQQLTILILDSGYHLQAECITALQRLGHRAIGLRVGAHGGAQQAHQAMRQLLSTMVETRPDFLLSINQIGFDAHGIMASLLAQVDMPVAVWYVDCPFLLYDGHLCATPPHASVFVWERSLIPTLHACGVEDVTYLPLGCDIQRFSPPSDAPAVDIPLAFVGSSMHYAEHQWRQKLLPPQQATGDRWAHQLLADRSCFPALLETPQAPPDPRMVTLAYATWMATGWYRQGLLRALLEADLPLHVFGDAGWQQVLPTAQTHPAVPYGAALAALYARCYCSFNATSLQMPTAVNQRAFDVFAAGGLVLGDAQSTLAELFEGVALPTYENATELITWVRYYQTHPRQRQACIALARAIIAQRHTYMGRLEYLVRRVRVSHGPRVPRTVAPPSVPDRQGNPQNRE